jgi:hypothetical protein
MGRTMRPIIVLLALILAACSPGAPVASAATDLHVQNSTTLMITIVVNGGAGVSVAPGVLATAFADLPPLPWTVEAQTESGRTLATMFIGGAQDVMPVGVASGLEVIGSSAAFPLSCGSITMWVGPAPADPAEPSPDSSPLPDCAGG